MLTIARRRGCSVMGCWHRSWQLTQPPAAACRRCTARNTTSSDSDVAAPQSAEARVKSPIETISVIRAPNRSPTQPEAGIATASATR